MGLLPDFNTRVRALMAAAQEAGYAPQINSAYRSPEDQKRAVDSVSRKVLGRPASVIEYSRGIPGYAAPVGASMHQRGEAVDFASGPALDWLRKNASAYGVRFPESLAKSDPVHAESDPNFWGPVQDPNDRNKPVQVPPSAQPDPAKTANYVPRRSGISAAQPMMALGGPQSWQQSPQPITALGAAPMPLNDAQPQGFDLNQWATSPLFMMGAGVLGGQNIGQGLMQGVQASNQARTGQLRNTLLQQQMDAKKRQQAAWQTMFSGGQPNMAHPLLKDLPPDMIGLAQIMGPEAGLSALHDYAMKRHGSMLSRQAEMEKIRAVKQLEQEIAAENRKRMIEAVGPLFGQSGQAASPMPQTMSPQQTAPLTSVPGVRIVPGQTSQPAPPVPRPAGELAIQPAAPAFTPDMARLAQARIALGDTKGALEIYEKALENAQVPGREAEKTIAVERAKAVAGEEKSSKAARDMWALLDQMERGTTALGDGRLDAAANPDFDTWWGRNVSRRFSQEAYNDRLKLKTIANSMVLQARETQRGLGQLTEGEQKTLEEAYTTMMSANNADEFKNAVSTVRMVLAAKIPEKSGYVAPWISKLEDERTRREERAQPTAGPTRRDMVPPKGKTQSVDSLGPELEGKDVYDSQTGQWGRVINGEFVSRRAMMQGEAKRRLLNQQVN